MKLTLSDSAKIVSGVVHEIGANLAALNLYPLGLFESKQPGKKHSKKAKNPRPILLVHGIVHNRSAFIALKHKMERQGWDNLFTLNYSTTRGNILQMVEALERKVEEIIKKTGSSQIDIVAHSLGGLVARTYMSLGEGRGKVKKLITLGTAHRGTNLSFMAKGLARGALDGDLKVNSYLIKLLNSTALPTGSELVSIYSTFDWTVWPQENGKAVGTPERAIKNIKIDYVGHTGLLYSPEAFDAVVKSVLA